MHNRSRHDATFTDGCDSLSGFEIEAQRSLKSVLMVVRSLCRSASVVDGAYDRPCCHATMSVEHADTVLLRELGIHQ